MKEREYRWEGIRSWRLLSKGREALAAAEISEEAMEQIAYDAVSAIKKSTGLFDDPGGVSGGIIYPAEPVLLDAVSEALRDAIPEIIRSGLAALDREISIAAAAAGGEARAVLRELNG